MDVFERQIAIIRKESHYVSAVFEGQVLDNVIVDEADSSSLRIGDIRVGRVSHIVQNINAAFVEVQKGVMCYLPLSETGGETIVQGKELPVQIKKAAVKSKQAVATGRLQFAGQYAVITSTGGERMISRKITKESIRRHLKELLTSFSDSSLGILLRTSCETASDECILEECRKLIQEAETVFERAKTRTCFSGIYRAEMEIIKHIRSVGSDTFDRIITDEPEVYETLREAGVCDEETTVLYKDESYSLDKLLGISSKLKKALAKHVWLKSGASLVIEPTEALTVIDVNTEKAIQGKRNRETTFFKINREAAREAARQIRIRNISGIILIDFIGMKDREHVRALLDELQDECQKDSVRTTVVDITKLGLVELTRMKIRKPLWEVMKSQREGEITQ